MSDLSGMSPKPTMRRRVLSMMLVAAPMSGSQSAMPSAASSQHSPADGLQSTAERRAGVEPRQRSYPEGDIRRYGANPDAPDNSTAFNEALSVSAHGGRPAFVPGGSWRVTSPLRAIDNSSMFGVGNASVIVARACDGLVFGPSGDYSATGMARFFRDFQITGADKMNSSYRGIVIDFSAKSTHRVSAASFENLYVANFAIGAYLRGLWFGNFVGCHFYNCYSGIYFIGENILNCILNCAFHRGDIRGSGGAWGASFQTIDGETTQSTRIISSQFYFYDVQINVLLVFELQIEHCELSAAQSTGVHIIGTIGGCWVRDCMIETNAASATTGVDIANVQTSQYTMVHIVGNHITCDLPCAGSRGISVGYGNSGIVLNENAVVGFDQGIFLGGSAHVVCKFNRVHCVTSAYTRSSHAILLDSLALNCEIGPNEIIQGSPLTARMSPGDAEIAMDDGKVFPAGTPVQFDADANGFKPGVTYFVLESRSGSITVGGAPGALPITPSGDRTLNVRAAPLPLAFTSGPPHGLSFFGSGAFFTTLSGFASTVGGIVQWTSSGGLVSLSVGTEKFLSGQSNSREMSAAGIPAFLLPPSVRSCIAWVRDAGLDMLGIAHVNSRGDLTFYKSPGLEPFTSSGQKGIGNTPITYVNG
jgi:hypothetical protein